MKTLIIYSHPNTKGHCSLLLEEIKKRLKFFEVIDLYKIRYDPILHEKEMYTAGNKEMSKQNKEFQKKIKETDKLLFIYPNWWNNMPAILKGFTDKVITPGFGYKFVKNMPVGLLKGKKAAVITTHGGPAIVGKLMGNRAEKVMTKDVLGFCGIKAKYFIIDNCFEINEKQRQKIRKTADKAIRWLG